MMDLTLIVPVLVAAVEMVKMAGLQSKYAPFVSVGLGALIMFFLGDGGAAARIFEGLVAGLTAAGLYSGVKAQFK